MKPTQIRCSEGSVNQLPPWTEIQGDIRLTPFYDAEACLEKVMGYVASLNSGTLLTVWSHVFNVYMFSWIDLENTLLKQQLLHGTYMWANGQLIHENRVPYLASQCTVHA